ncbi:MAG: response regulator [Candidatus Omnitrophica bacterium]|nr:response regulator [Candidatus Omnitrophota bacterium]
MAQTILVADDDRGQVELFERALKAKGYEVLKALDGEQAYDLALSAKPDLILLDVSMPKMDGDLIYTYLKAPDSPVKHIPILFVTGLRTEKEILESGEDNIFAKPVSLDKLLTRIADLIHQ